MGTQNEERRIRLAVHGDQDQFLGYKIDSFWSLDEEQAKPHSLVDDVVEPHLLRNFLVMINDSPEEHPFVALPQVIGNQPPVAREQEGFTIVAQDYESGEELRRYVFSRGEEGEYSLVE